MAFGIVTVRMTAPECIHYVEGFIPVQITGFKRAFLVETVTCGVIYIAVAWFIQLCCFPISKMMVVFGNGILNMIFGAAFRMFKYLFILSIVYNVLGDLNPSGTITKSSRQHDGNVVEGVMKIAPPILDFPGGEEIGRRQQLEDAKKIS